MPIVGFANVGRYFDIDTLEQYQVQSVFSVLGEKQTTWTIGCHKNGEIPIFLFKFFFVCGG